MPNQTTILIQHGLVKAETATQKKTGRPSTAFETKDSASHSNGSKSNKFSPIIRTSAHTYTSQQD